MRLRTLLMTTSLALVALSLPPASADPVPDDCRPATVAFPDGSIQLRDDCTASIGLWMTCAPPSHTTISRGLPGGHDLSLSVCDGGVDPGRLITVSSGTAMPGCPPRTIEKEGPYGTNRIEQEHNCRTTTTLNEGIICLGGSVDRDEYHVLGHTVVVYSCGNPNQGGGIGDPIALGAASAAPGCEPTGTHAETVLGGVYVGIDENCLPDVRHNGGPLGVTAAAPGCQPGGTHAETVLGGVYVGIDENCLPDVRHNGGPLGVTAAAPGCQPGGTHAETVLGGVYVGIDENCLPDVRNNGALGTTSAEPGCQPRDLHAETVLGGTHVEQEHNCRIHATLGSGCDTPATVNASGSTVTVCHPLLDALAPRSTSASAAPSCQKVPGLGAVSVSDDCYTVSIRLYECVWGGYWNERHVGPFTVRDYRCGPPTATSTASIRDPFPTCVTEPCDP